MNKLLQKKEIKINLYRECPCNNCLKYAVCELIICNELVEWIDDMIFFMCVMTQEDISRIFEETREDIIPLIRNRANFLMTGIYRKYKDPKIRTATVEKIIRERLIRVGQITRHYNFYLIHDI